jgi:8-oxo-dGTP pyrophosphatase MutT (NUDIX family)
MTTFRFDAPVIRIAAAVVVDEAGRTLLVRKRGTRAFMQPGGKIGDGETAIEALERELQEELGCGFDGAHRRLGQFSAPAANEADTIVEAELFAVHLVGEIAPAAEIEEVRWHHPGDAATFPLAPLTRDHVIPLVRSWRPG